LIQYGGGRGKRRDVRNPEPGRSIASCSGKKKKKGERGGSNLAAIGRAFPSLLGQKERRDRLAMAVFRRKGQRKKKKKETTHFQKKSFC